jgi:hypothetical protein
MSTDRTPQPTARTYTTRGTKLVVSRTALDTGTVVFFEITVLRVDRAHPTYQGTVVLRDGMWHAEAAGRNPHTVLVGVFAEYVDAENALVARRTGITSTQKWTGPRPRRCEECRLQYVGDICPEPSCYICGHHLYAGQCRRLELHWTPESLAEDELRRRARHVLRDAARAAVLARAEQTLNTLTNA